MPWQKWLALHALELKPDGSPRFKTIILMVGRQNGKTTFAVLLILFWLSIQKRKLVVNTAQDMSTAEETWDSVLEMYQDNPLLAGEMVQEPVRAAGKKALILTEGRRLMPKASNRKAGRGLSIWDLFLDELREQRTWDAWGALDAATIAVRNSITFAASNAGDIESIVLAYLRDSALGDIKEGTESGVALFEWSADEKADPGDPAVWREANPGFGYTISESDLRSKFGSIPLGVFRTEHLCQWVMRLDSPIDIQAWEQSSDSHGDLRHVFARRDLHMAVEVSNDAKHVTLAAAGMDRADSDRPRVRTGIIKTWAGESAVHEAEKDLKGIIDKARPRTLSWYPSGPGAVLKTTMEKIRSVPTKSIIRVMGTEISSVCMALSEQVSARVIINDGSAVMATQILGAKRKAALSGGWKFEVMQEEGHHVDALYATAAAVQQARMSKRSNTKLIVGEDM